MAACALASGRARDGALYSNRWIPSELSDPPSEVFYAAAKDSIPKDLSAAKGTSFMRACAILATASIQNGQIKAMQQYSGIYHTLISVEGLHDEKLWPKGMTPIEIEERRRLVSGFPETGIWVMALNETRVVLVHLYIRHLLVHRLGWHYSPSRSAVDGSIPYGARR